MLVRIAVCDDEKCICSQLESMIMDIFNEKNLTYEVETFESGESLCQELKRQHFDLIFLDIELPNINGVGVGRYIREVLKNEMLQIVYISAREEYAMELFEFRPMNFLRKPIEKERVEQVIEKYRIVTEQNYPTFEYMKNGKYYKVLMSDIIYFENQNRKIIISTIDFEDVFYGSMEDVYERVKDRDFLLIHKSIVINYRFVRDMGYKEVVMTNGKILPISQSKRTEVRAKCMRLRKRVR